MPAVELGAFILMLLILFVGIIVLTTQEYIKNKRINENENYDRLL